MVYVLWAEMIFINFTLVVLANRPSAAFAVVNCDHCCWHPYCHHCWYHCICAALLVTWLMPVTSYVNALILYIHTHATLVYICAKIQWSTTCSSKFIAIYALKIVHTCHIFEGIYDRCMCIYVLDLYVAAMFVQWYMAITWNVFSEVGGQSSWPHG